MRFKQLVLKEKLFDLESYGCHLGHPLYSDSTLLYSLALTYHPTINRLIKDKQKQLPSYPYSYPDKRDFKILSCIQQPLDENVISLVDKSSTEILNKLEWGKGWKKPIMIKIYTNILPIPSEVYPFSFIGPNRKIFKKEEESDEEAKVLNGPVRLSVFDSLRELAPRIENSHYPFIVIKERLKSKKSLIDFINENFDTLIKPASEILPSRKHRRADIERFMLAVWLFDLLHNQNRKPKEVSKMIEKEDPEQNLFIGYDMTSTGISKLADEARVKMGQIYPI